MLNVPKHGIGRPNNTSWPSPPKTRKFEKFEKFKKTNMAPAYSSYTSPRMVAMISTITGNLKPRVRRISSIWQLCQLCPKKSTTLSIKHGLTLYSIGDMNGNYIHGWGPIANFGAKGFVLQNPKVYHHVFPHSNVPSSGNGWFKHGLIIKASKVPQLGLSENGVPKNLIVAYFLDYNCYIFVHLPFVDRHDNPSTPEAASSMPVKPLSWVRKKCQKLVDQKAWYPSEPPQ